ncbi:hypothetical protein ACIG63_23440 [Streptomyces antimycoticus]|uniref:hypothetical protein n=1 Tax=Streptomyces antimycoticus TaxID=68175 RepID=UPI0037CFB926
MDPFVHFLRLDGIRRLRDIEARHPALRGAKTPMHTITDKRPAGGDSLPVIAGAAVGLAAIGAALALADVHSPLRAPFTLFFLLAAPALAIGSALRGLDALIRPVLAVAGALALDLLVAQAMLALRLWSARGGVAAVGCLSLLILVPALLTRLTRRRRMTHSQE